MSMYDSRTTADVAGADLKLAELQTELDNPPASEVPWLDLRPLREPPCPWSEDDWQRDQRRAAAADLALTRELWASLAEQGRDAVDELRRGTIEQKIGEQRNYR